METAAALVPYQPPLLDLAARASHVERYESDGKVIRRYTERTSGGTAVSIAAAASSRTRGVVSLADADRAFLRGSVRVSTSRATGELRIADLFSGAGGLSLGIREACTALGLSFNAVLAVDMDKSASAVYSRNFEPIRFHNGDISMLLDGRVGAPPTVAERQLIAETGRLDMIVGGPPCEGHSAFNNRTRHADRRNQLYLRMVRAAELFEPEALLIENVPGAMRDRTSVVQRAMDALGTLGYHTSSAVVDLSELGVPQTRRRLVVLASRKQVDLRAAVERHAVDQRDVAWAIDDLEVDSGTSILNEPAASATDTRRRIAYLFERDLFDLPDSERPACHSGGNHSYKSIYGRLRWDRPAQTITSGFYSMCMGRYVHPSQPRTLTAHEAARLQFFPDFFTFADVPGRTQLARLIGDAVPMKLGYVVALELLR